MDLESLDIRELGCDLPGDIDALAAYWDTLSLDDKELYDFFLNAKDFEGFFKQLRFNCNGFQSCGATESEQKQAEKPRCRRKQTQAAPLTIPYPHDLTRCSPFFPVPYVRRRDQAKVLPYLNDWPLATNSWGTLTYKGPTLTTAHEDLLVALLALVQDPSKREEVDADGKATYRYTGSLRELLCATGVKHPNGQEYDDAFDQLADLAGAVVSVLNSRGKRMSFASLLTGGSRNDTHFSVTINPEFLRAYQDKEISYQKLELRASIRSLVGRALYRFVAGQQAKWKGSFKVLAGALNLDQDKASLRKLRAAIKELIDLGVLSKGSDIKEGMAVLTHGKELK